MSSSTSSRSTLTMTPSTMSPSLKYLIVWSIAARKSSAEPMSLIAIWGVLEGRTWVEVMWLVAPDGGCVGTGRPQPVGHGDDQRGEPGLASPMGDTTTDLWRTPHGTDAETHRSTRVGARQRLPGVSRSARHG